MLYTTVKHLLLVEMKIAVWKQFGKNVFKHWFGAALAGAVSVLESMCVCPVSQDMFFWFIHVCWGWEHILLCFISGNNVLNRGLMAKWRHRRQGIRLGLLVSSHGMALHPHRIKKTNRPTSHIFIIYGIIPDRVFLSALIKIGNNNKLASYWA